MRVGICASKVLQAISGILDVGCWILNEEWTELLEFIWRRLLMIAMWKG